MKALFFVKSEAKLSVLKMCDILHYYMGSSKYTWDSFMEHFLTFPGENFSTMGVKIKFVDHNSAVTSMTSHEMSYDTR